MSQQTVGGGRFAGKVAVVTGGGSGIGRATARRLVAEGGQVVIGDIQEDAVAAVVAELGDAALGVVCDVTAEADVVRLVDTAVNGFGGLDVAFANAGIGSVARTADLDLAEWSRVLDVNLTGPFLTVKHAARQMRPRGAIVVTSSLNAVQAGIGMSAYCSSKAGVAMLVQVAAMELGPVGIRVNAVAPGLVRTGLTEGAFMLPGIVDGYEENTPLGRHATPEEIAGLVAFLASDEASFITGSLYLADGGAHTMRYPDILGILERSGAG
jgi:NAD(P)-dependent dehydrogenase (short-subunit alcohol dehydrogenase family)